MTAVGIPTGVEGMDAVMGGFQRGDNVILENTVGAPPHSLLDSLLRGAIARGDDVFYVSFDATRASMEQRLASHGKKVTLVDCFTHGRGTGLATTTPQPDGGSAIVVHDPQFPAEFRHAMQSLPRSAGRRIIIVDSLNGMAMLWGEDRVAEFYASMCPTLFDAGDLAVWVLHRGVQSPEFHAQIGHIAQVILNLDRSDGRQTITVERAIGRPGLAMGQAWDYTERDGFRITTPLK